MEEEEEEEEEEEDWKRAAVAIRKLPASGYLEGSKGVCLVSYVCEKWDGERMERED